MLGHALVRLASARHEVWGGYRSFPVSPAGVHAFSLDLTEKVKVEEQVGRLRPDVIVHTAALTGVDACEKNASMAERVNVQATKNLVLVAKELRAKFMYISTDYVFDGTKGFYVEADTPLPVNVYGKTKLAGEQCVRTNLPKALLIRTSIFGFNVQPKRGVVEYIIDALRSGQVLTRYRDQFSSPIYTGDLSRLLLELLGRDCAGMFHIGGRERVSRFGFAETVADVFSLPKAMIQASPFRQVEGEAKRPRDSSLRGLKIEKELGIQLPTVREGLGRLRSDLSAFGDRSARAMK